MKARTKISAKVRRELLLECGYCCSVQRCSAENALEFQHIDGNPNNNAIGNLIVLCSNHHAACTAGRIDRNACKSMKLLLRPVELSASPSILKGVREVLKQELSKNMVRSRTNRPKNRNPQDFTEERVLLVFRLVKIPTYWSEPLMWHSDL